MNLVELHKIPKDSKYFNILSDLAIKTTRLYNDALYLNIKSLKAYEQKPDPNDKTKGWLFYNELNKRLKNAPDEYNSYKKLPIQTSQQTLKLISRTFNAYCKAIKAYKQDCIKFTSRPRMPKLKHPDDKSTFILTNQQAKFKNGKLRFPQVFEGMSLNIVCDPQSIREVRFIPKPDHFRVEVVYKVDDIKKRKYNNRTAGIDLGLDNLATVVFSDCSRPFIVSGKPLKSMNSKFNIDLARYQSLLEKTQNAKKSNRKYRMFKKRDNRISDYMHKATARIVDELRLRNISRLVIGHNKQQKKRLKGIDNFVQLPIFKMIHLLEYKCELVGIEVYTVNESYTSGTSFLDNEQPSKTYYDNSRREYRGLFISADGRRINADVNGAYQILRKKYKSVKYNGNKDIFNPIKWTGKNDVFAMRRPVI